MKTTPLIHTPSIGTHIKSAVAQALRLSRRRGREVRFSFNGTTVRVRPRLSKAHLLRQWDESMHADSLRYRNSREGKLAAQRLEDERRASSEACADLVDELPDVNSAGDMVSWLRDFLPHADRATGIDYVALDAIIGAKGLAEPNQHVGNPEVWFADRPKQLAEYLIGQARVSFREGHVPPQILLSMIKGRYRDLTTNQPTMSNEPYTCQYRGRIPG